MTSILNEVKGPLAMGIHWAHDASVSICSPQGILFSVAEERITRIKHYYGFPREAIKLALEFCRISAKDIEILAFSSRNVFYPSHPNRCVVELDGSIKARGQISDNEWKDSIWNNISDEFGWHSVADKLRMKKMELMIRDSWGEFTPRHYLQHKDFLEDLGFMDERIVHYYIAHHRAHAASAFRLSGLDEACVISIDGKGDGISATILKGSPDGKMHLLRSTPAKDSLGSFYQATTEALGFTPVDGEYKTMGLAALGKRTIEESPLANMMHVEDGVFKSRYAWEFRDYNKAHPDKTVPNPLVSVVQSDQFKQLSTQMAPQDFAHIVQAHFEDNMLTFARQALQITGSKNLVGAGGVMLNVKANTRIKEVLKPNEFFVFPDSADSGLSAGAAMEALYVHGALKSTVRFRDPYMGHSYPDATCRAEVEMFGKATPLSVTDIGQGSPILVARMLAEGKVVGTFQGRMEMGPRSLGNRAVLADARTSQVKDRINLILKGREYFVPFAPVVLEEEANLYWDGSIDYRFMTFAVNANEYAKRIVPAVVHVDGTMRPQVVSKERNAWLFSLLQEYKKLTGVGVLINTSFNRHGLPIVGAPTDALDHLANKWIDGLAIGTQYVELKQ